MSIERKGAVCQVRGSGSENDQSRISSTGELDHGQDCISNAPGQHHLSDVHHEDDSVENSINLESGYGSNILSSPVNNIHEDQELDQSGFNLYENSSSLHLSAISTGSQSCKKGQFFSESYDEQETEKSNKITVCYTGTENRSHNDESTYLNKDDFSQINVAASSHYYDNRHTNKAASSHYYDNRHINKAASSHYYDNRHINKAASSHYYDNRHINKAASSHYYDNRHTNKAASSHYYDNRHTNKAASSHYYDNRHTNKAASSHYYDNRHTNKAASSHYYDNRHTNKAASSHYYDNRHINKAASSHYYDDPHTNKAVSSHYYDDPNTNKAVSSHYYDNPHTNKAASSHYYDNPNTNKAASNHYDNPNTNKAASSHNDISYFDKAAYSHLQNKAAHNKNNDIPNNDMLVSSHKDDILNNENAASKHDDRLNYGRVMSSPMQSDNAAPNHVRDIPNSYVVASDLNDDIPNNDNATASYPQNDKAVTDTKDDSQKDDLTASSTTNGIRATFEEISAFFEKEVENGCHSTADSNTNRESSVATDLLYVFYGDRNHNDENTFSHAEDGSNSSLHFDILSPTEINNRTYTTNEVHLVSEEIIPLLVTREILQETDTQYDQDVHNNHSDLADYRLPFLHLGMDIDLRRMHQLRSRVGRNCVTCFQHPIAVQNWPCGCFCNCTQCAPVMVFCSLCQARIESFHFF